MERDKAIVFLHEHIAEENIFKHLLATEAAMGGIFDRIGEGKKEEWMMAGLLHDGDYVPEVAENLQGIKVSEMLAAEGFPVPQTIQHAMAAHNWHNTGVAPESKMDWALFCVDSLTGLVTATVLVRPDRKLATVEVKSVLKKFKDPTFARGTRREEIKLCEEKLGIPLAEFIEICLTAMQKIAADLSL